VTREASIRARGGDVFEADDLADPPTRTEGVELPAFTDEAQADPKVAREEFVEQAERNPVGGDSPTAFSVRAAEDVQSYGGFGARSKAPEGSSELPGQFFAADISNLRLPGGDTYTSRSMPRIGIPSARNTDARVLAETDVDVGITEGRTTQEVGEFLADEADRGQSFVRTDSGGPTPEQEVIAPPRSVFETGPDQGLFGVRVGGRDVPGTDITIGGTVIRGRTTRRVDPDGDGRLPDGDADELLTREQAAAETSKALREARRRADEPSEFVPAVSPGTAGDGSSSGRGSGGDTTRARSTLDESRGRTGGSFRDALEETIRERDTPDRTRDRSGGSEVTTPAESEFTRPSDSRTGRDTDRSLLDFSERRGRSPRDRERTSTRDVPSMTRERISEGDRRDRTDLIDTPSLTTTTFTSRTTTTTTDDNTGTPLRRRPGDLPKLPGLNGPDPRDTDRLAEADSDATGWLSETVATIATEGRSVEAAEAPDLENIRDQPDRLQLVGENPTAGFFEAETREDISTVQDLFGLDDGGRDSQTENGGSDSLLGFGDGGDSDRDPFPLL